MQTSNLEYIQEQIRLVAKSPYPSHMAMRLSAIDILQSQARLS